MGNKLSTTSPFSEVTFSDVALSSEVTVGLLEQHFMAKISSDGTERWIYKREQTLLW